LRRTVDQREIPQVLLVSQEVAAGLPSEKELPPAALDANVEIFLLTLELPHSGQITSLTAPVLKRSSSKSRSQFEHSNSNIGIKISLQIIQSGITYQRDITVVNTTI